MVQEQERRLDDPDTEDVAQDSTVPTQDSTVSTEAQPSADQFEQPFVVVRRERAPVADMVRYVVGGVLIAVVAIFAAANRDTMAIDLVVTDRSVRLAWIVLGAAVVGAIAALMLIPRRAK